MPTPETMNCIIFVFLIFLCVIGFVACMFLWVKEIQHDREKSRKQGKYNDPRGD